MVRTSSISWSSLLEIGRRMPAINEKVRCFFSQVFWVFALQGRLGWPILIKFGTAKRSIAHFPGKYYPDQCINDPKTNSWIFLRHFHSVQTSFCIVYDKVLSSCAVAVLGRKIWGRHGPRASKCPRVLRPEGPRARGGILALPPARGVWGSAVDFVPKIMYSTESSGTLNLTRSINFRSTVQGVQIAVFPLKLLR